MVLQRSVRVKIHEYADCNGTQNVAPRRWWWSPCRLIIEVTHLWQPPGLPCFGHIFVFSILSCVRKGCLIVAITWKFKFCWLRIFFHISNQLFLELKFLWCCILFESEFLSAPSWIWWVCDEYWYWYIENIGTLDEDDCDWYVKVWWQVRWNVGDGFSQWWVAQLGIAPPPPPYCGLGHSAVEDAYCIMRRNIETVIAEYPWWWSCWGWSLPWSRSSSRLHHYA